MAQLNIKLAADEIEALRRYAARRRTPISWLVRDYIQYLLAGGKPVLPRAVDAPEGRELAQIAHHGGAFDWLAEEPELYSLADGEPV